MIDLVTRIGLESYEVMACHGVYDFEREKDQPFIISIWATLSHDVEEDNLELTLNYADLQSAVDSEIVNSKLGILPAGFKVSSSS